MFVLKRKTQTKTKQNKTKTSVWPMSKLGQGVKRVKYSWFSIPAVCATASFEKFKTNIEFYVKNILFH